MSALARESYDTLGIGLNERNKFTAEPRAKVKCFMPRPYAGILELSTYSLDGLVEVEIWDLLDRHLVKGVLARAELTPAHVAEAALELDPNWDPERHVNIIGWPAEEFAQKNCAQVLHARQVFVRR